MRALALTLSVSVYAVTTVLCAFMAGLALGAWIAGRMADRLERPLFAFGLVEIGVGASALISLSLLFDLGPAYAWFHETLGGAGPAFMIARFLLASAVLLVPCTLMGMTLPLLSRAVIGTEDSVGRGAGGLYAINTFGAVAGCVAAGFVLIPEFGLSTTSMMAAALNLAVGVTAVMFSRGTLVDLSRVADETDVDNAALPLSVKLATLGFGISGFTAIGYEVLWTRALEQFTHNSTYAYTAMLATFLIGIALGSTVASGPADRSRRPMVVFGLLQVGVGVTVVIALLIYMQLLDWLPAASAALGGLGSWPRAVGMMFSVSAVVLLATTLLFGAQFPFVARAVVDSVRTVGRRIAVAYTLNTVGSSLGALTVGFYLLPTIGMSGSFLFLIAVNLVVGVALASIGSERRSHVPAIAVAVATMIGAIALIPPEPFKQIFLDRYGKLLMYREQVTDIVMVTEDETGGRLIRYGDGRGTAGTITYREDRSYAHLALLSHPDPKNILNICFGVGNSLSSVSQYPVERIDQVELSPGVVYAAPFFESTNRGVLQDPRVHLTIQDGRNYLIASRDKFDIIRLDPPELHTAGIVNLYTKEFFELARDHLEEGGIFSIWVNIAYTPEEEMRMILRTAAEVFPHVTVWHGPWLYSWVINGSNEPRPPDMALLNKWFAEPKVRADLATIPITDPYQFLNHFVMADDEVRNWSAGVPIITDDRTTLDFTVPRSVDSYFGISNSITDHYLTDLINTDATPVQRAARYCEFKQPVLPHLVNAADSGLSTDELARRLDAQLGSFPAGGCIGPAQAEAARSRR